MEEIISYVYKKYGILLNVSECEDFINWFKSNSKVLTNESILDQEASTYLYDKYKGRPIHLNEEDLSSLTHLLSLLKKELKNK